MATLMGNMIINHWIFVYDIFRQTQVFLIHGLPCPVVLTFDTSKLQAFFGLRKNAAQVKASPKSSVLYK